MIKPTPALINDFDAIADALAAEDCGDVLLPAERFLLAQVPAGVRRALDVGCGDGMLTRALAGRGISTLGLDVSPGMIALARDRSRDLPLAEFQVHDLTVGGPPAQAAFDLVISAAVAHHVPLEGFVAFVRAALAPGGTALIQDLTTRRGPRYAPWNTAAVAARALRRAFRPSRSSSRLDVLYARHGAGEECLQHGGVREAYRTLLPGVRVYLHLEWRYTVVWHAPGA
ncbi:MAG: class I SAM-dependent methyltransferase [Acidobacteria bacterium]|nr:class I SAM-dependent methyltransferase [Acidobacteriota bacterium]